MLQPDINQEQKLAFTCTQEADHLPPLDPQADIWFKQARAMQKASGPKDFAAIGALYRKAAQKDHYKAMINLQNMLRSGLLAPQPGRSAPQMVLAITERLITLNIPAGYYVMGTHLQTGYAVKRDQQAALAYFRKAADLGNPEGQNVVGNLFRSRVLIPEQRPNPAYRPEIGKAMLACAANQGNAEAAMNLAGYYAVAEKNYPMAVTYYQVAIKHGSELAPFILKECFSGPPPSDELKYLALPNDPERVRRYGLIEKEIDQNRLARFPDIDKIVPLPPTPLPEWDGSFEYKIKTK
ncbi:DUF6396 domain-containing protein [Acerihabitans sp. TG2]|uniref:SEL1-like repeat protein n=1 Tax=Acerihabitans sp. TG2 TaxID=3096008 RepID=UPI002B239023|nr:DUF6396 domain-containing protein [Acerihabitans sp. TG2]MEA9389776.1 DUF6396 domain-containing protein [Acerihabitans sp. TG2]